MWFELVTLRFYHSGVTKKRKMRYNHDGEITNFLDVDIDRFSYFELRDYGKKF